MKSLNSPDVKKPPLLEALTLWTKVITSIKTNIKNKVEECVSQFIRSTLPVVVRMTELLCQYHTSKNRKKHMRGQSLLHWAAQTPQNDISVYLQLHAVQSRTETSIDLPSADLTPFVSFSHLPFSSALSVSIESSWCSDQNPAFRCEAKWLLTLNGGSRPAEWKQWTSAEQRLSETIPPVKHRLICSASSLPNNTAQSICKVATERGLQKNAILTWNGAIIVLQCVL